MWRHRNIALGQVTIGGPDTVLAQVRQIGDELGAGVLDLVVGAQLGERTLHSIVLFGAKVLSRVRTDRRRGDGARRRAL